MSSSENYKQYNTARKGRRGGCREEKKIKAGKGRSMKNGERKKEKEEVKKWEVERNVGGEVGWDQTRKDFVKLEPPLLSIK